MKALKLTILIVLLSSFNSCYYDKYEELYPSNCDTSNVSYSKVIQQINAKNCQSCHASHYSVQIGGGVCLETYSEFKEGNKNNKLINSIKHDTAKFPMPPSYILEQCEINQIISWFNAGAQNN